MGCVDRGQRGGYMAPGQRESERGAVGICDGGKAGSTLPPPPRPLACLHRRSASRDCCRLEKRDEWWGSSGPPTCATIDARGLPSLLLSPLRPRATRKRCRHRSTWVSCTHARTFPLYVYVRTCIYTSHQCAWTRASCSRAGQHGRSDRSGAREKGWWYACVLLFFAFSQDKSLTVVWLDFPRHGYGGTKA